MTTQPQAILRVQDLSGALGFYAGRLAFAVQWYGTPPGTAGVRGPGSVLLVLAADGADVSAWPGAKEPGAGAWVYLNRPDLPALAADLAGRGFQQADPVVRYPGYRHIHVRDPDGYLLVFWESLPLPDAEILALYSTGPVRLREAVAKLNDGSLDQPWEPGKWTVRQIVHHIADSDMGTFHTLRMALAEPGRLIQPNLWDPDRWMAGLCAAQMPIDPALALFEAERAWVVAFLLRRPDGLEHHVQWPSGYRATVRQLLQQVGGHALHHILQIHEASGRSGV